MRSDNLRAYHNPRTINQNLDAAFDFIVGACAVVSGERLGDDGERDSFVCCTLLVVADRRQLRVGIGAPRDTPIVHGATGMKRNSSNGGTTLRTGDMGKEVPAVDIADGKDVLLRRSEARVGDDEGVLDSNSGPVSYTHLTLPTN